MATLSPDATIKATSGSSGGNDLATRMIDETLAEINAEKNAASKGPRALANWRAEKARQGHFRLQALLAIRSGFERRVQADAIDALAAHEAEEASNGLYN